MSPNFKRILTTITAIFCLAFITACSDDGNNYVLTITPAMRTHSGFHAATLEIAQGTLATTDARFVLRNRTNYEMIFDEGFRVQRWDGEGWVYMTAISPYVGFGGEALIYPREAQIIYRNWEQVYGELPVGIYRFLATINSADDSGEVAVVFAINYGHQADSASPYLSVYNVRMYHSGLEGRTAARATPLTDEHHSEIPFEVTGFSVLLC